jgi:hypothetical protein
MGWMQNRHLQTDVEDVPAIVTRTPLRRRADLRVLRPTGTAD